MKKVVLLLLVLQLYPSVGLTVDCGVYEYKAEIIGVYDGDTVTADIDLGFNTWRRDERLRLYRINAPEVRGEDRPEGLVSRDALREKILGKEVIICTIRDKKGKYGRYLAEIHLEGLNINDWLVDSGYAVYKDY
jgi:micrococcal nuclease